MPASHYGAQHLLSVGQTEKPGVLHQISAVPGMIVIIDGNADIMQQGRPAQLPPLPRPQLRPVSPALPKLIRQASHMLRVRFIQIIGQH